MNVRNAAILFSVILGLGMSGFAQAAQAPNYYECSGKNVGLNLTLGSKAEVGILPPTTALNLQLGKKSYTFQEADIEVESTLIGDLWEVTLEHIPDLHIKHAAVVIPTVALGQSPLTFKSQLIVTTVATPFIAVPFEGVVNPSRYIDLTCTASMLYF